MADILETCRDSIMGWYSSPDRIRVNGTLRRLQHPGVFRDSYRAPSGCVPWWIWQTGGAAQKARSAPGYSI